jgi:hypothetical protein
MPHRPVRSFVETLLRDAEATYSAAARLVALKPRTETEGWGLSGFSEEFYLKECNLQFTIGKLNEDADLDTSEVKEAIDRIYGFDKFIWLAVDKAAYCENTKAQFLLERSRQLLDHAWIELNGNPKQRSWEPPTDIDGPKIQEKCIKDGTSRDSDKMIQGSMKK